MNLLLVYSKVKISQIASHGGNYALHVNIWLFYNKVPIHQFVLPIMHTTMCKPSCTAFSFERTLIV